MNSERVNKILIYLFFFGWWVLFFNGFYVGEQSVEPVILCDPCSIFRVSITPDGEKVVLAGGRLYLFDNQGNELWVFEEFGGSGKSLISDDGSFIAAISSADELWNGFLIALDGEGKILWERETGLIDRQSIAMTPDGSYIAVGSTDKETGRKGFLSLFTKDGDRLWVHEFPTRVESVAISNQEEYVLAGIRDDYVYLFDRKGNLLWSLYVNTEIIGGELAFFSDENHFIVPISSTEFGVFDVDGNEIWTKKIGRPLATVAISPEGSCFVIDVAVGIRHKVYLFDRDGNELWEKGILLGDISALDVSENCEYVVVGGKKGITEPCAVVVFDKKGNWLWDYEAEDSVYTVAISQDGKYVVMGGRFHTLRLFDNFKAIEEYERKIPLLKILGMFFVISSIILLIWNYLDKRSKKR